MALKKEETKKDHLKWMLTFSDMMTLLLAFFVLLISMSSLDQEKLKKVLNSLKGSLGVLELGSLSEISVQAKKENDTSFLNQDLLTPEYFKNLKEMILELTNYNGMNIMAKESGYIISIDNDLIFDSGSADIKESASLFLDKIILLLKSGVNHIEVQGFTDNIPINGGKYSSNWALSAARANSVVKYLIEKKFNPKKFSTVAYGETRPIYPNTTPENRKKNRRVEIVVDSPITQLNLYVRELTE